MTFKVQMTSSLMWHSETARSELLRESQERPRFLKPRALALGRQLEPLELALALGRQLEPLKLGPLVVDRVEFPFIL